MQLGMSNPINGRRQGLARADAGLLDTDPNARQNPALRLDVRRAVTMHPVLAATVAGVVFLLLVACALTRTPLYTAESLIYVEPLEVRVLSDGSAGGYDPSRYDSYLQQQVQTVERPDTLEAALGKLPPGMWNVPGADPAIGVRRLGNALKVERVLNSYQLAIDVSANTAAAAAAGANAITAAYLEAGRKDEHARADQRLQLLNEERQRISADLTRDKAEQSSLGRTLGVANPNGASGNPYDLQSEGLRSQLASARVARDAVSAQLASVSGGEGKGLDTAANELIVTDPGLVSTKQTLSQRRAVLSAQMAGLTPANPAYKQGQEEIATIDRAIDRATAEARTRAERQLQDKLRLDLRRTADVEGRLNAQLAEQTSRATGAGPKLQRAAELETDIQRLSTRYASVDDAIRGLQLETGGPGQAHLALAARVPDAPQASRSRLVLWLSLPLALLCGMLAAVLALKRDPKLYLPGDMEEVLGFPPMCVLPKPSEVGPAAYEDFLLRLAGGIEGAHRHGGARSFVFTPASIQSGSDGLLQRVSTKLRQVGFRVICISTQGLMSAASDAFDPAEADASKAEIVPAGESAGANRMQSLLEEYDLVLIQAPALLGSALTEYVVRCADATILMVESTRTNRAELRRAALLLERLNPQGIGAVLADMPMRYADSVFREAVRAAERSPIARPERSSPRTPRVKVQQPAAPPAPKSVTKAISKIITVSPATWQHDETPATGAQPALAEDGEAAADTVKALDRDPLDRDPTIAQVQPHAEEEQEPAEPFATALADELPDQDEPLVLPLEVGPLSFHKPVETRGNTSMPGFEPPPPAVRPGAVEPVRTSDGDKESAPAVTLRDAPPAKEMRGWRAWNQVEEPLPEPEELLPGTEGDATASRGEETQAGGAQERPTGFQAPAEIVSSSAGHEHGEGKTHRAEEAAGTDLPGAEDATDASSAEKRASFPEESGESFEPRVDVPSAAQGVETAVLLHTEADSLTPASPFEEPPLSLAELSGPKSSEQPQEDREMQPEKRVVDSGMRPVATQADAQDEQALLTPGKSANQPLGWLRKILRRDDQRAPTGAPDNLEDYKGQAETSVVSNVNVAALPGDPAVNPGRVEPVAELARAQQAGSAAPGHAEDRSDVIVFRDPMAPRTDDAWAWMEKARAPQTDSIFSEDAGHSQALPDEVFAAPVPESRETTSHASSVMVWSPGPELDEAAPPTITENPLEHPPADGTAERDDFFAPVPAETPFGETRTLEAVHESGLPETEPAFSEPEPLHDEPAVLDGAPAPSLEEMKSIEGNRPRAETLVEANTAQPAALFEQQRPVPEETERSAASAALSGPESEAEPHAGPSRFRMLPRILSSPAATVETGRESLQDGLSTEPGQFMKPNGATDRSTGPVADDSSKSAAPVQRTGLTKAIQRIAVEDGPPARASEGLTAMRSASGVHRAAVVEDLTPAKQEADATLNGEPGMSRRWAMLSRFGRPDLPHGSMDQAALDMAAATGAKGGAGETARDPRV